MPEYRRAKVTGGTYFFTVTSHERRAILTESDVRRALREGIQRARVMLPFKSDAWVLLPDHLHCIWTLPEGDANFPARWAMIKRHVSQCCHERFGNKECANDSHRKRKELAFWQRRFWEHQIRDETDFRRHVDYIHWNPVKHGLVKVVKDWPYSTFNHYAALGIYPTDWGGARSETDDAEFGE